MQKGTKAVHIVFFALTVSAIVNTVLTILVQESSSVPYYSGFWASWVGQLFWLPTVLVIVLIAGGSALLSWAIANKAEKAGRSWAAFFWLSALVSPIIMGIIAVTLKPLDSPASQADLPSGNTERGLEPKLEELHALKEKGILTDEEFEKAKKKALGI